MKKFKDEEHEDEKVGEGNVEDQDVEGLKKGGGMGSRCVSICCLLGFFEQLGLVYVLINLWSAIAVLGYACFKET